MSDDFSQMESHVESAVCGLRTVQGAGKYPKKVCSAAMYGANMLNAQKGAISNLRHDNDRMVEEIAELKGASDKLSEAIQLLTKIAYPIAAMEDEAESCGYDINVSRCISLSNDAEYLKDIAKQGLAKLNQEGEG